MQFVQIRRNQSSVSLFTVPLAQRQGVPAAQYSMEMPRDQTASDSGLSPCARLQGMKEADLNFRVRHCVRRQLALPGLVVAPTMATKRGSG